MVKKAGDTRGREEALSRDRIIEASIALLDRSGESGLTFRALSDQLATGPGAIYWHIANKSELLIAACDSIIADVMNTAPAGATPKTALRILALSLFDAIDAHPWIGAALVHAPGRLPLVRILERIGQQVRAMGIPDKKQWATVGTLLNYVLGVGGQNAANGQLARTQDIDRSKVLASVSNAWSQLDPDEYPFTRSMAEPMRMHDDRMDFLAGVDLILAGIESTRQG